MQSANRIDRLVFDRVTSSSSIILGAKAFKLKFGHIGGNYPIRTLEDYQVYITAQNHGYASDAVLVGG